MAIAAMAATAAGSHAKASSLVRAEAGTLAPGSYQWEPSLAPAGSINVVVDLTLQRLFVYRGGTLIGISTISSGKPGYETPAGKFTILEKERFHNSNKYDNAPMPYMQRLSWSGLALHGGHPRGYPASHGCIRLPMGFAAALFKEQTRGMQVVITGHAPGKKEIRIANHENPRANPQCCEANGSTQTGDLQATKYWGRQGYTAARTEAPGGARSAPPPDCAADRDPADETGADDGDASGGCDNGTDRGQHVPPPDLPPPPG